MGEDRRQEVVYETLEFVGTGYTDVAFTLPESRNYEACITKISVAARDGYNITVEDTAGG